MRRIPHDAQSDCSVRLGGGTVLTCGAGGSTPPGLEVQGRRRATAAFYRGPRGGGYRCRPPRRLSPARSRNPCGYTADAAITAAVAITVVVAYGGVYRGPRGGDRRRAGRYTVAAAITAADTAPVTTAADIVAAITVAAIELATTAVDRRLLRRRDYGVSVCYHRVLRRLRRRRLFRRRLARWRLQRRWLLRCRLLRRRLQSTSATAYGGGYGYGYGGGYGGCQTAYIPYGWTWYRATSC